MKQTLILTALILAASLAVFADIARPDMTPKPVEKPKTVKQIDTFFQIKLDKDAKEAKLVIPKKFVKELRAALDEIDNGEDTTAAATETNNHIFSRTQTIVSGIFLSLGIVFGGMWFVRSGKSATKAGKALVIVALGVSIGSVATFVYANAGPPPAARSITGRMFSDVVHRYGFGSGKIKLEVNDDGQYPTLIVPNSQEVSTTDE